MIRSTRNTSKAALVAAILTSCTVGAGSLRDPDAGAIQLRKIEVDSGSGQVTLRWTSQEGKTYTIEETSNPEFGWQASARNVSGDPRLTTWSVLPQPANYGAQAMLFRVRETDPSLSLKGSPDAGVRGAESAHRDTKGAEANATVRTTIDETRTPKTLSAPAALAPKGRRSLHGFHPLLGLT